MAAIQGQLQDEFQKFQKAQQEYGKHVGTRQKLDGQLTENKMVYTELEKLEGDDQVYKLIGPLLLKQDLAEAKSTVKKRMDYISGELKRYDDLIDSLDKKQEESQNKLQKLQQQFQQFQQIQAKAAAGGK